MFIIKRRRKSGKIFFPLIIIGIILSFSIGYSMLSERVNISGNAVANYAITGTALQLGLTQTSGRYSTGATPSKFTFNSETLSGNTITINYTRKTKTTTSYPFALTVNFKSTYPYTMSSGTVSTAIVSGSTNVVSKSVTISSTSIAARGNGSFTVNATCKTSSTTVINIKATIAYTTQGVTQYFYYVINIA